MARVTREPTYNLQEGVLLFRWGDKTPQLKRHYPQTHSMSRNDLRASGKLVHMPGFIVINDQPVVQAITDRPADGAQTLWLEPDGSRDIEAYWKAVDELLARLGCTPDRITKIENDEQIWEGDGWDLGLCREDDEVPVMISRQLK